MEKRVLHTPEGVRDVYGEEYSNKMKIQKLIHSQFKRYGFMDIDTPTFEFFDVFSKEVGTTPSKELYKFFDKDGNTLVLRPDFTPSMARCAAKYFMHEELPIRFCYSGNTFTNTSNLQGKLKENTEMGVELIGDDTIEADAEMICLVIDALKSTGLQDFQISIGEVDFFKGLCMEAGLVEETELELRDLISNKNYFGAEELLSDKNISDVLQSVLLKLTNMFGSVDTLVEAKSLVSNDRSRRAIERLEAIYELLKINQYEKYITFDLGMLSKYNYYTGVIFKGYTYGVGDAIVKGGRYNNLLEHFGKPSPAIGFVVLADSLLTAMKRQNVEIDILKDTLLYLYTKENYKVVLEKAREAREAGINVQMLLDSHNNSLDSFRTFAENRLINAVIRFGNDGSEERYGF